MVRSLCVSGRFERGKNEKDTLWNIDSRVENLWKYGEIS